MASISTYLAHVKESVHYYAHGLYREISNKQVFLWSQAIAFKVLVTVVPVIILATGVVSTFLLRNEPFQRIAEFIREFLPAYQSDQLINFLSDLQQASGALTIIGAVGLLFLAMTLFTTLRIVIANVFQEDWHETRTILGGYLFDIRMVAQVGLLFLLTFSLTVVLNTLNAAGFEFMQRIGLDYVWVREGWRRAITATLYLLPFILSTAMFFQLIYFIPKPHPPKHSALIGSIVTALLWEAAKYSFTFYASQFGRFERYSSIELGKTFGLIIFFVFWVYYSGAVLVIGALVTLLHEKRHRSYLERTTQHVSAESPEDDLLSADSTEIDEALAEERHAQEDVPVK